MKRRTFLVGAAAGLGALSLPRSVHADVLSQPARMVIGTPAGGSLDTLARVLVDQMKGYAPSVVVENKPGAGTRIAVEMLKMSAADGSMMGLISAAPLTMYPHVYKTLRYDVRTDLAPVATVCSLSFVVMVGPAVPAELKTFPELVRWLQANPDKAAFASPGTGSLPHFVGTMLAKEVGVTWVHIPYTGAAPALQDLLGGRIPIYLGVASNAVPYKDTKDIRTMAITAPRRLDQLPDVPTMRELGHPALEVVEWVGVFVPKKTPQPIVHALADTIVRAQDTAEVKKGVARISFDMLQLSHAEFVRLIERDMERWAKVVKDSGFPRIE